MQQELAQSVVAVITLATTVIILTLSMAPNVFTGLSFPITTFLVWQPVKREQPLKRTPLMLERLAAHALMLLIITKIVKVYVWPAQTHFRVGLPWLTANHAPILLDFTKGLLNAFTVLESLILLLQELPPSMAVIAFRITFGTRLQTNVSVISHLVLSVEQYRHCIGP